MNIERLTKIAEWLEREDTNPRRDEPKFDMSLYYSHDPHCGTVACIAGAAMVFFGKPKNHGETEAAMKLLGLQKAQARELFYALGADRSLLGIDAAWAARTVRKLIATGAVDWRGTAVPIGPPRPVLQDGGQFYDEANGDCIANYGDTGDFERATECREMFKQQHPGYYVYEGDD